MTEWRGAADHTSAETFARLAVELHDVNGFEETVEAVAQFALQAVRCDFASVVLVHGRSPEIVAQTHPQLATLLEAQIAADAGPLVTAIRQGQAVVIPDVLTETRWPAAWVEQACAAGIRSALHLPLTSGGRAPAVLSLFARKPEAFTQDDIAVAHILARHAAVAIGSARKEASLATAVDARKVIGQAMGILMERFDLGTEQAFEVLKRYSNHTNRKLRDVAQDLIDTRKLPTEHSTKGRAGAS